MELLVNGHQGFAILVAGSIQLAHEPFHGRKLIVSRPLGREPSGKALQHHAKFEYLLQVGDTDLRHEHAPPGSEKDEAFGRQTLQRLTDRCASYLQVMHQRLFVYGRLGREFQRDDLVPDELIGLVA